jgi:hypothetical protein
MTAVAASASKSWQDARREGLAPLARMPEPNLAVHPAFESFISTAEAAKSTWFTRLRGRAKAQAGGPAQTLCAAIEDHFAKMMAALPADPELLLPQLDQAIDALVNNARSNFGRETTEIDAVYQALAKNLKVELRREIYYAARRMAYQRREPKEAAKTFLPILADRGVAGIDVGKPRVEKLRSYLQSHIDRLNEAPSPTVGGSPAGRKLLLNLQEEKGFVGAVDDMLCDRCGVCDELLSRT